MSIGKKLKKIRLARNLTLRELQNITELDKTSLSAFENEKYLPSAAAIVKLCKGLGVSADYLLIDDEADSDTLEGIMLPEDYKNSLKINKDKEIAISSGLLQTLVQLVNETITAKNETIETQKKFNDELTKAKDDQINILKEVLFKN